MEFQVTDERSGREPTRLPSEALQQFERGEISEDEYLEHCVERTIASFRRLLSPSDEEFLREILQDHLAHDPVAVEMQRQLLAPGRRMRDPNCQ
jgi:hypothetical protein